MKGELKRIQEEKGIDGYKSGRQAANDLNVRKAKIGAVETELLRAEECC